MPDPAALDHRVLGHSPFVDRDRAVVATRLTVFAARPGAAGAAGTAAADAAALLKALADVWPGVDGDAAAAGGKADVGAATEGRVSLTLRSLDGVPTGYAGARRDRVEAPTRPAAAPVLSLNVTDEPLLRAALEIGGGAGLMLEVPAFLLADAAVDAAVRRRAAAGAPLLLKGRSLAPLAEGLAACFSHRLVESGEAPDPGAAASRRVAALAPGGGTSAALDTAFADGADLVVGWIHGDEPPPARGTRPQQRGNDARIVVELIQGVDSDWPLARLEATLRREPALAFKLMRYLNSPAFGLSVEINSFGQALMLLGRQRLKRWLALLLAASGRSPDARPLVHAALRRGLLMEALARERGDAAMQGEMFICGLFSLLDRLLEQPMDELLAAVPVPDSVREALAGGSGPYAPWLQLVVAIEQESLFDIRECAERLLLSHAEVNRSLLAALKSARQLDA